MRSLTLLVWAIFLSIAAFSQNTVSAVVRQPEIHTLQYEMAAVGGQVLYLPMDFGGSTFSYEQKDALRMLKNAIISRIDLVYSDYPAKTDLSPLTQRRLETLRAALPEAFSEKGIEFRKLRQTSGSTRELASVLQHGFFIYFRPLPVKGSGKKEVSKLTSLLRETAVTVPPGSKTTETAPPGEKTTEAAPPGAKTVDTAPPGAKTVAMAPPGAEEAVADSAGTISFCWQSTLVEDTNGVPLPALPEGYTRTVSRLSVKEAVARKLIDKKDEKSYTDFSDSVFYIEDSRDAGCDFGDYAIYEVPDSTVSKIFARHHWANAVIIADVTGSMYPYTAQLLKWLQLNLTDKQNRYFIFFNDGDDKPDDKKVIGRTGGIYPVATNKYDDVERTITTAMTNGSGGDAPENNIEALLASEKLCPTCDSIVMIADNWAPVKDLSLLAAWHKPVKVVLCGVFDKIKKDYLKLVRDTKGSLHLMEEDIYTLSKLKEGETIKIHGIIYKLVDGNFVDVAADKRTL